MLLGAINDAEEQQSFCDQWTGQHIACGIKTFSSRLYECPWTPFEKLKTILEPSLKTNEEQATRRGGAISPAVKLFATLRWLGGGSYLDIQELCGISTPTFYYTVDGVIKAILECNDPMLDNIHFPQTEAQCVEAAKGFSEISSGNAICNCVSVIDGYLPANQTPSVKEVGNVRAFFNGHYQVYGVNVQAACNSNCRFQFIAVAGPGVMPDRDTVEQVDLAKKIENLPHGYVSIGDAAYISTEHLCALFYGDAAKKKCNDNFNFYASQCRTRIEMAFGLMTQKWRILQTPMHCPVKKLKLIITAIAKLHNFIINERLG